MQDGISIDSI